MEASVATPGQGAPPAGTAPAGSQGTPGQGQPTAAGKGDAGFNWGLFPDVPEEQRELLEPHLRNVQGHVTRIEGQYAPYKGLIDTVQPDQVQALTGFLDGYAQDPVATVIGLVQQLQQEGTLSPQQLQQMLGQGAPAQEAQPGQEEIPPWAQQIMQRQQQWDQAQQEQQQAQQEMEQDQILESAKTNIRAQLTQGGISEELVPDETIVAFIIAHNGDEQAAAQAISQMRQNFLGAFTNDKTGAAAEPNVQGDLPAPKKPSGRRSPEDLGNAKVQAEQFLKQQAAAAAQGA